MKVVLVTFHNEVRRELPLTARTATLGRKPDCTIRIPAADVSREHCQLIVDGNTLKVRDLGSSNGTFVNGKRVAEATLKAGDRLTIGPAVFIIQIDGQPANVQPAAIQALPPGTEKAAARSARHPSSAEINLDDEEILDLDDVEFDDDDALTALDESLEDEEDSGPPPKPQS